MKAILIAVFLMGLGPMMFWLDGDLGSDFGLRGHTLVPANIATSDRRCRSTFFILNQCSFKYQLDGEKHSKNYVIFSLGAPDTVRLLKSAETGELTSTVGQDYYWNRIIALLFFNGISLFVAIAVFASMFGGRRSAQPSAIPQRAAPAAAPAAPAGMPAGHGAQAFAASGPHATFGQRNSGSFGQR